MLLGGLGVHRFYLGQWWGIVYLVFFWTYIPALIAIVEAIQFFTMSEAEFDAKHCRGDSIVNSDKRPGTTTAVDDAEGFR